MSRKAMLLITAAVLVAGMFVSGCSELNTGHDNANLSLVEIGERSLESAEQHEYAGNIREADIEYRKALWAFRYHERLTGEQPLLLDEAEEGARRMTEQKK